jgi:hypothetical protein
MRSDARVFAAGALVALALGALGALGALDGPPAAQAASSSAIVTDTYAATAPRGPWRRIDAFDESGRVAFEIPSPPGGATAKLALSYEAIAERDPAAATTALLERERALVRGEADGREGVERSAFRADSIVAGGLVWRGFRVDVKTPAHTGRSWRWFALHPEFPRRTRAYRLAFDEYVPLKQAATLGAGRIADARAFAASVKPRGPGWTGPLGAAFGDVRAATFAARIDSALRLCWSEDADEATSRRALGFSGGAALEGDFFELSNFVPRDSLVDAASPEYGTAFDRNRDGRYDLLMFNRGVQAYQGERLLPTVAAIADDDFDGKLDAAVIENVDRDGDGKPDARLYVQDTNGDGSADRATLFRDAVDAADATAVAVKAGVVPVKLAGQPAPALTFDQVLGPESPLLARLDRARKRCTGGPAAAGLE